MSSPERLHHERGLGIPLMRTLTDVAEITSSHDGTSVRLVLFHDPPDAEHGGSSVHSELDPTPSST